MLGLFGSIRIYVWLSIVVVIALVAGTLIPQGGATWQNVAADGKSAALFTRFLGLRDIYHSWWFILLGVLLAVNILCCNLRRFSLKPGRLGSMLTHLGFVLILAGGAVSGIWGERGSIYFREGEIAEAFAGVDSRPLGFKVHLRDFILTTETFASEQLLVFIENSDKYWKYPVVLNREYSIEDTDYRLEILRYVPDLRVELKTGEFYSISDQPNNPAIQVKVVNGRRTEKTWLFAEHPDMNINNEVDGKLMLVYQRFESERITDFESKLDISEDGKVVLTKTIRVNDPLRYKGYTFYQADYDPDDLTWSGLDVVKDPGVSFVYAGFCVVLAGMILTLYINPIVKKQGCA